MPFVVGLTGGIGSGKSTVAALFAQKGIPVIDADDIARKITQPNTPAFHDIVKLFGKAILLPDGTLDRAALRQQVFQDAIKRKQLEQLLHPRIRAEMASHIAALDAPYCIAMIPLLLETAPNPLINRVLVIDAPEALQRSRAATRDNLSPDTLEATLQAQISRVERLKQADDVILNDKTIDDLVPEVDKLHALYLTLARQVSG